MSRTLRKCSVAKAHESAANRRKLWGFVLLIGIVVTAVVLAAFRANRSSRTVDAPDIEAQLSQAASAFEQRDFDAARRQAYLVLNHDPENAAALLIVGKCLESRGAVEAAAKKYAEVPPNRPPHSTEAAWRRGNVLLMKLARPSEAERWYLRALKEDPFSLPANTGLTLLYGFSRQWWLQIPTELAVVRSGKHEAADLFSLAQSALAQDTSLDVAKLEKDAADDPLVRLASARAAMRKQKHSAAITMLRSALRGAPHLVAAHVCLGEIYFELGDMTEFVSWSRRLPKAAESHPTTWVLRAKWARQFSTPETALRCYCEAIDRDPNQGEALYQAGRILTEMKRPDDAAPFLRRAHGLEEYVNAVTAAGSHTRLDARQRAAELAESLGNTWEAFGWAWLARSHPKNPQWSRQMVERYQTRLATLPLERTESRLNPVRSFPFRSLPLPSISLGVDSVAKSATSDLSRFSFEDRSAAAGISFQYFNGSQTVANGMKLLYESMGGGVAVIDFDGDLLPDLYFTQGGAWPVDESKFEHLDRLYLNRGDGKFLDVTDSCGIRENRFSHGAAAGDFDSDGFPDLLIGNIGRNRLYRNNGDGTFSDFSDEAGLTRSDWTTSCAIADLTGDGHPELYFVNYLQGENVFTLACGANHDKVCGPQQFEAANDRVHWNIGDGRFRDVTESSGIVQKDGKGLGIVIASFAGSKLPNLFVANDMTPNFYFENESAPGRGPPKFRETAMLKGLALSDEGRAQACMGIAAGDADGNGEIDLFVTNFHAESNAYYRFENGSFRDAARTSGLRQPSLQKLGFGTQFLDADLDGRLDLIVANGHIDNFSRDGRTEYQMQPQFFANVGKGQFREVDATSLGGYFQRKLLGRGLARLDWNGDGREDAVISHLDAPAALLQNQTRPSGGYFALHLRGVESSRDAIGAIAEVTTKARRLMRQLTAGDGFLSSNERVLIFGLGSETTVEKLTIRWPSGRRAEFTNLPANSRWIAVEGARRLYAAPKPR